MLYFDTFCYSLCHYFQLYFRCTLTPSPGRISTRIIVSSHRDNEYETLGNFTQERKKKRKNLILASNAAIEKKKVLEFIVIELIEIIKKLGIFFKKMLASSIKTNF